MSARAHPRGERRSPRAKSRQVTLEVVRTIVIAALLLIVASLGSALFFVLHDRSGSNRAVKALAVRVGVSMVLFLFLMAGFYFGWIPGRIT